MSEPVKISSMPNSDATASGIRDTSSQDVVRPQQSRRTRNGAIAAAGLLLLVAGFFVIPVIQQWLDTDRTAARAQLRFATVTREAFVRDVNAQGVVVAAVSPSVFATSAGTVSLHVKAGDPVNAGDLIASIDSPELDNELEREQATLQSLSTNLQRQSIENRKLLLGAQQTVDLAVVELTAAERELRRADKSWEFKVISRQDLEKAQDDVEKARFGLKHAKRAAALDAESLEFELATLRLERDRQQLAVNNLQRRVKELQLTAPVSGIVGNLAVERQANIAANQEVATVIDLSALEVDLSVSDTYADDLRVGAPVQLKFAGQEHQGLLVSVSPEVINSTVSARVRFDGEQPGGLRQSQRVSASIILESRDDALVVDRGPFYDSGAGRLIYRVNGDVAELTSISAGASSVSKIEILDGLEEGDQVVISSLDKFNSAERVLLRD
ncbi:MAG: efflux RND transporter periplasmic adaptor subunit [Pseudomonadota bacterium]